MTTPRANGKSQSDHSRGFARQRKLHRTHLLMLSGCATLFAAGCRDESAAWDRHATPQNPLPHQAYVWQRQWTEPLREALQHHGNTFDRLVILGAEISLGGGEPKVVYTEPDYELLKQQHRPIGMALRISAFAGPFRTDTAAMQIISATASRLLTDVQHAGLKATELQLDFDCATSKLNGYRAWLESLRSVVKVSLTFTALPTWLDSSAFPALARSADGFVLQVHSLERPAGPDAQLTLCDPIRALAAVEKAGKIGVPFRVALPTYGYVVAFDGKGEFAGISTGEVTGVSPRARIREVRSDPVAMAGLVKGWQTTRPASMVGVIWYRFPVEDRLLNWRWTTLESIMLGRVPCGRLVVTAERGAAGLWDVYLSNQGDADIPLARRVTTRWVSGDLLASDAMHGFEVSYITTNGIEWQSAPRASPAVLTAGGRRMVGWIRLSDDKEVTPYVSGLD